MNLELVMSFFLINDVNNNYGGIFAICPTSKHCVCSKNIEIRSQCFIHFVNRYNHAPLQWKTHWYSVIQISVGAGKTEVNVA